MMENFMVITASEEQYPSLLPLIAPEERDLLPSDTAELLIAERNEQAEQREVCGALLYEWDEDDLAIRSLYVRKDYRGQGAGMQLLEQAELRAIAGGARNITLTYEVTDVEAEEATARKLFFMRRGYGMPSEDTTVLTIPMESLKDSCLVQLPDAERSNHKCMVPFDDLPYPVSKDYRARLGKEIPQILDRSSAPGSVIPEMTLAYVYEERIVAFVVCCDVDGTLHLHAAYVESQMYIKALICLLKNIVRISEKKQPAYRTLTITAATDRGRLLAEKLLDGAQITRRTIYSCKKPLPEDAISVVPQGFDEALVRFHTLTDELSKSGIASYLNVTPGQMPRVELPLDEENELPMAVVRYFVDEYERHTTFMISAGIELPVADVPVETLQERINPLCDAGIIQRAYWKDEGKTELVLEAERSEEEAFESEETVRFLSSFLEPVRMLAEECAC